jgi:general secretion pathway protein G
MKTASKNDLIATGIILTLIILLYIVSISPTIERARYDSTRTKMEPIESAINKFFINTGVYPLTLEDLSYEFEVSNSYLKESQLYDPWDRLYIYHVTNDGYELISYGKDGKPGGKGYNADISND